MKRLPRHLMLMILALTSALLACLGSAPITIPTPAASFSTATPGGSISVSLLTPTATLEGLPGGTPIGPVATATAYAATALAQTATAAVPSPTIPGIFTEPARCPAPGSPTLPTQSPPFTRYAETIVQYLSAGGASTVLEASLRRWGAITDLGGLVRPDRDFTGDGVPEVLIVALDPQRTNLIPPPGDLFIFGCEEGAYRLLYQAGYALDQGAPVIISADDINGDYLNDMVYTVQTCGATACYGAVKIIEWRLALRNFASLLSEDIVEPYPQVVVSDIDGDGPKEVSVTSGLIASIAAGPQRIYTTIWKWDGTLYALSQTITSPAEYRIHVIHDADDALRAGDTATAVDLYRQAATDDRLLSWQYPDEALYLKAYARFRMVVAYALAGNITRAQSAYDALIAQYAPPTSTPPPDLPPTIPLPTPFGVVLPGSGFVEMARLFWQDYALNRNVGRACQIVTGYARANPASYEVLNSFGFANRTYTANDMCPFTGQ